MKGRDWYDFLWYASRGVPPALQLLTAALDQQGPWAGQGVDATPAWYCEARRQKVLEIDWGGAAGDLRRFLRPRQQEGLELWGADLFLSHLEMVSDALSQEP